MKTKFSNHEAVGLQFMTQSVNSLLSGENCLKQRKSTYSQGKNILPADFGPINFGKQPKSPNSFQKESKKEPKQPHFAIFFANIQNML